MVSGSACQDESSCDLPSSSGLPSLDDATELDHIFNLLSDARRRFLIHTLVEIDEEVDTGWLAHRLASWEYDVPSEHIEPEAIDRYRVDLHHHHLPHLEDHDVISTRDRGARIYPEPKAFELFDAMCAIDARFTE